MKISATPVYNNKTLQSVDLKFEHNSGIKNLNLPIVSEFHCSTNPNGPASLWYSGDKNSGTFFTGNDGSTEFIRLTQGELKKIEYGAIKDEVDIDTSGKKLPVYAKHQNSFNLFVLSIANGSFWGESIYREIMKGKIN